jgi:hypothetical protein
MSFEFQRTTGRGGGVSSKAVIRIRVKLAHGYGCGMLLVQTKKNNVESENLL